MNLPPPRQKLQPFICDGCGREWLPTAVGCPNCPPNSGAKNPDQIYEIGVVTGSDLVIGPAPRNSLELRCWAEAYRLGHVVDVSDDPNRNQPFGYVAIPQHRYISLGLTRTIIQGLVDHDGGQLNAHAFNSALFQIDHGLEANQGRVMLHCVAGLRRAPTIAYAWLRSRKGLDPQTAWNAVLDARPYVVPVPGYIDGVENWLLRRQASLPPLCA